MEIRNANPEDALGIAEAHRRAWQIGLGEYFSAEYLRGQDQFSEEASLTRRRQELADPEQATVIAVEAQQILGFATFRKNQENLGDQVGELQAIYVDPDSWDKGVGSALLQKAVAGLAAAGFLEAILWTVAANSRTRTFYESRGWRVDGGTKPHRTGVQLVRYRRELGRLEN